MGEQGGNELQTEMLNGANRVVLEAPMPSAPCAECVRTRAILDPKARVTIVWCHHARFGALFHFDTGRWEIHGPYDDDEGQSGQGFAAELSLVLPHLFQRIQSGRGEA